MTKTQLPIDDASASAQLLELQKWRKRGPVGRLHNMIKFIRQSPTNLERFSAKQSDHHLPFLTRLRSQYSGSLVGMAANAAIVYVTGKGVEVGVKSVEASEGKVARDCKTIK